MRKLHMFDGSVAPKITFSYEISFAIDIALLRE